MRTKKSNCGMLLICNEETTMLLICNEETIILLICNEETKMPLWNATDLQ